MILGLALLAGCAPASTSQIAQDAPPPAALGSDRDAHGCIGSAGYLWCERSQSCERPWELAKAKGLTQDSGAFDAWCAASP